MTIQHRAGSARLGNLQAPGDEPFGWRFRASLALVQWLSRRSFKTRESLARKLGALYLLGDPVFSELLSTNVSLCFPDLCWEEHQALIRDNATESFLAILNRFRVWSIGETVLRQEVQLEGEDVLHRFMGRCPLVLLCPHFLGYEIAIQRLALEVSAITIYKPTGNLDYERFRLGARTRFGVQMVVPIGGSMVPIVRRIQEGVPLMFLPDVDTGCQGAVFSPFFGVPAATPRTAAWCACKLGAVILPISVKRIEGDRYRVSVREPLNSLPRDVQACADRLNETVEGLVRETPSQYWWLQPRFATRPPGTPRLYSDAVHRGIASPVGADLKPSQFER